MQRLAAPLALGAALMSAPSSSHAQTDWRMTLAIGYALRVAIDECRVATTAEQRARLDRVVRTAERRVDLPRGELDEMMRRTRADALKQRQRFCDTVGRDAPRVLSELPDSPGE